MSEKQQSIGALWISESKNGAKYMSGSIEIDGVKHKIVVFKNTFKEEDKHPDYRIFPSTPRSDPAPEASDDIPF